MARHLLAAIGLLVLVPACGGGGSEQVAQPTETSASVVVDLTSGDPAAGKPLFTEQGCANCHTFVAAGSTRSVGPDLDEVAKRYPATFILKSIIDPSAYIETGSEGTIGGSERYRVPMPPSGPNAPNGENVMTEQELADVVAFIESSGRR
jgi:cytochrome c551/c552